MLTVKHDPSNPNCDRTMYSNAPETMCTCDVDRPEDAPQPSIVMPAREIGRGEIRTVPAITLTGSHAEAYQELQSATRELEAAKAMLKPAEARWRAALDRFHAEMLR